MKSQSHNEGERSRDSPTRDAKHLDPSVFEALLQILELRQIGRVVQPRARAGGGVPGAPG